MKMKDAKFISIFVLLLILITLLIFTLWCVVLPEDAKDTVETLRRRRELPHWVEQKIEKSTNESLRRSSENALLTALGRLMISSPEDIMTFITLDSPCKHLKPYIEIFERHHKDLPDNQLFVRLFKAIKTFNFIYCGRDERYRKLFAKWQDELLNLHENFEDCEGARDWYENINATVRCEDARSIEKCYVVALQTQLGVDVASAWKCIFKPVVNQAMIQPCNGTETLGEAVKRTWWMSRRIQAMILFATVTLIAGVVYSVVKFIK